MSSNSFESVWTVEDLKQQAEEYSEDELDWYRSENTGRVVGIDWNAETVYVIDPDSPNFPCVEIAQFEGIDVLFSPTTTNEMEQ